MIHSDQNAVFLDNHDLQSLLFHDEPKEKKTEGYSKTMLLIITLTRRIRRWTSIPLNDTIKNLPPNPTHFRLTLVVTADLPDDTV